MNIEHFKVKSCDHCDGTGRQFDHVLVGAEARKRRMYAEVSLREIAKRIHRSAAYVSDLELGRRNWNETLFETYLTELGNHLVQRAKHK